MEKPKAVIYARVSDESQILNNSLETQLKSCKNFADSNALEVVKVYREEGVSAKNMQRPQMNNLLEFCMNKNNNISRIIVYKMDRWTRNVEEGLVVISLLANYGIVVIPATEVADQTPFGKAMRTILMAFGELDNNMKSEKVIDNMQTMFRNGYWCWKLPIGYMRAKVDGEDKTKIPPLIHEKLGEIINLLFLEASQFKYSKKHLADYANKLGFENYYGKKADGKLITHILTNSFYYGYMYAPKWKEYSWGKHTPITDQETWIRANNNTFGRSKKYKYQDNSLYPLKGVLACKTCNHPLTSSNPLSRGTYFYYYECHQKYCTKKERIQTETSHKQFLEVLKQIKPTKRVLKLFTQLVFDEWDKTIQNTAALAKQLDKEIDNLELKLTAVAVSNTNGILTNEEATKRAEELRRNIAVLKVERSDIRIEQYNTEAIKNFTETFLLNLDRLWLNLQLPQKQELQNAIFPQGLVAKDKAIQINSLSCSFELIEALTNKNFNLVTPREFESRFSE